MNKWTFPHGKNLTPTGLNNAGVQTFLDNMIESLTREVIQNSLDARDEDSNLPVRVSFDFKNIETNQIPGLEKLKNFALPRAINFWNGKNVDTLDYLRNFEKTINSGTVTVLKISDYNTIGLHSKAYEALIIGNGYTEKLNEDASGSKGIGKFAPFASSDLRLVFYNSVPKNELSKHVGVLNFVSFNYDDKDKTLITQERAHYHNGSSYGIEGQIDLGFGIRSEHEQGTDLYIIGLRNTEEDWEKRILLSAVNNFLVSIWDEKLVISINDEKLDSTNIGGIISSLQKFKMNSEEKSAFKNTQNYYDALTNANRLEFNLDDSFVTKYDFIENRNDAKLILLKRDDANRRILQTRSSGMKIYDRKSISGNINFTGVFRATGTKLSSFLRNLENPRHTNWSEDQLIENRDQAKQLLKDLLQWFKKCVKDSYEIIAEDEIDAIGLSEFLPLVSQNADLSEEVKDSGIRRKIDDIRVKRRVVKNSFSNFSQSADVLENNVDRAIEEAGFDDPKGKSSPRDSTNSGYGTGSNVGSSKNEAEGSRSSGRQVTRSHQEKFIKIDQNIVVKSVSLDSQSGKYRFILKSQKSMRELALTIAAVREDGRIEKLDILESTSATNKVKLADENIRIKNIKAGSLNIIDVTLKLSMLIKMEVKMYEVKR